MFDILGEMECSLGEIMAQQSRGFTRPLKGKTGTIRFDSCDSMSRRSDPDLDLALRVGSER